MVKPQKSKRTIFALDLSPQWKRALQEVVLPQYPDEGSGTSLARHVLQDFILSHFTESEAREAGILAPYKSLGKPDVLIFAMRRAEELRRAVNPVKQPR